MGFRFRVQWLGIEIQGHWFLAAANFGESFGPELTAEGLSRVEGCPRIRFPPAICLLLFNP